MESLARARRCAELENHVLALRKKVEAKRRDMAVLRSGLKEEILALESAKIRLQDHNTVLSAFLQNFSSEF
jgi:hypothetical protein